MTKDQHPPPPVVQAYWSVVIDVCERGYIVRETPKYLFGPPPSGTVEIGIVPRSWCFSTWHELSKWLEVRLHSPSEGDQSR
jgi:hypothetical protein